MRSIQFSVAVFAFLFLSSSAAISAQDWGLVTIQSKHGYGSTVPFHNGTPKYLENKFPGRVHVSEELDNSGVGSTVNKLKNGDVLVINTHANADVFGVADGSAAWNKFYNHWNAKPIKPSLVVIHGCVFNYGPNKEEIPATDDQLQAIRRGLDAKAIISFNTKIHVIPGRISLHNLMVGIADDTKIASLIKGETLRFLVDPSVDRENVTLSGLRKAACPPIAPSPAPKEPEFLMIAYNRKPAIIPCDPPDVTDVVPDDIVKNTGQIKVIQYFVFLLTNSSNGLYVGSEDSLKGRVRCGFEGGGIGCKPSDVITYRKLAGPYATHSEAYSALCQGITESRIFPIGIGLKGKWQGGPWYGLWDSSVTGCPSRSN